MATQLQIAANRRNSRKSTGPKTVVGKAAVGLNHLQHGVFSSRPLLPGEDSSEFAALRQSFLDLYKPANPTEHFLVDRIVLAAWRLNRLAVMEVRILAAQHGVAEENTELNGVILRLVRLLYARPESRAAEDLALNVDDELSENGKWITSAGRHPASEVKDPIGSRDHVALAYIRDSQQGNTIFKFVRYQTALERSFYRAIHEFERLRASSQESH